MDIQLGGLKKKDSTKTGFQPIVDMINSSSGQLTLLTYASLKGFMIQLDVNEEDSEYFGLKNKKFTKPITSYILKFAVITPYNDKGLDSFKNVKKASESPSSYYEEAKLQQKIWINSIIGGKQQICPPVADFFLFDTDNSKNLCIFFQSKTNGIVKEIFDYFEQTIDTIPDSGLGVIIMPNLEKSTTFSNFLRLPDGTDFNGVTIDQELKNDAFANVTAQVIRLFIDIGVIHFDLHGKNALVFVNSNNTISSVIIDFGRASDLLAKDARGNKDDDDYLTIAEKDEFEEKKLKYYNDVLSTNTKRRQPINKEKLVLEILDFIKDVDKKKSQQMFGGPGYGQDKYQMGWYENYDRNLLPEQTFSILYSQMTVVDPKIVESTIQKFKNDGELLSFDGKTARNFKTTFEKPESFQNQCNEETGWGCSVMGGKKHKTKKNKKHKTKKNKKTKRRY